MSSHLLTKTTQNDQFRKKAVADPTPGPELYLRPELKMLNAAEQDMIKTKVHNHATFDEDDHHHEQATFDFNGQEHFFYITVDPYHRITIGRNYDKYVP